MGTMNEQEPIFPREHWEPEGPDGKIPVYVVRGELTPMVAATWDAACEFVRTECNPAHVGADEDPADEGTECRITLERREWEELSKMGEWSP